MLCNIFLQGKSWDKWKLKHSAYYLLESIQKACRAKDENKLPSSYDDIARSSFAVFLQDTVCTYHCTDNHPTKPAIPN
jgi:hypothetical protein